VEFEWDENKAIANLRKHRVDFADAVRVFRDIGATHVLDDAMDYDEDRFKATGLVNNQVLVVIYVERSDWIRLISARKATKREETDHLGGRWPG
jgi:uncharacterized DUF497 family protein